eukprot:CAMPEP_0194428048 /NCGR_PEP_ID=MMETSP0176-20130528/40005_1 /TAXON_ID=216777 /ORGANISM="Proboscia alata, Strain PI-D3" /LENGTH=53 /DNA_ID=CAMNT_0039240225 /DNA_START=59 /DNA_END=216 /DNA_ORIENTATION=-
MDISSFSHTATAIVYRDPVCAFEMTFEVILDDVPLLEDEGLIPMDFSNACIAV